MRPSLLQASGAAQVAPAPAPSRGASARAAGRAEPAAFEAALDAAAGERSPRETGVRDRTAGREERERGPRGAGHEAAGPAPVEGRPPAERADAGAWAPWRLSGGDSGTADDSHAGEDDDVPADVSEVAVDATGIAHGMLPAAAGAVAASLLTASPGEAGQPDVVGPEGTPDGTKAAASLDAVRPGAGDDRAAQGTVAPAQRDVPGETATAFAAELPGVEADPVVESDGLRAAGTGAAPRSVTNAEADASPSPAVPTTTDGAGDAGPAVVSTAVAEPPRDGQLPAPAPSLDGVRQTTPADAGDDGTAAQRTSPNVDTALADAMASATDDAVAGPGQGAPSPSAQDREAAAEQHGPAAMDRTAPPLVDAAAIPGVAAWRHAEMDAAVPPMQEAAPSAAGAAGVVDQVVKSLRVQWKQGLGEARIQLRPEHLGPVDVSIKVEGGAVTAVVRAESAQVQEWLLANQQSLRQQLEAAGLRLDDLVVSRDGERRQQHRQDSMPEDARRRARARRHDDDPAEPIFSIVV